MRGVVLMVVLLAAPTLAERELQVFGPGEQATYKVSWLGVPAGEAQVTVGAATRVDETHVWPIVCTAKTTWVAAAFPVKDKFVTWWDDARDRTVGNDFWIDELKSRRRERIRFAGDEGKAFVTRSKEGGGLAESEWEVEKGTLDVASAAMALRKTPLGQGSQVQFPVFTGTKRLVLKATVTGRESMGTVLGPREVWKLEIQTDFNGQLAAKKDLLMFVTADRQQLPVKIEAEFLLGSVIAELVQYAPGQYTAGEN